MKKNFCRWGCAILFFSCTFTLRAESLYQSGQFRALVSDQRAYRVGDNLTVLVFENASATTSAGTTSDKTTGVKVGISGTHPNNNAAVDLSSDYEGSGKVQRSGKLLAQITVTVKAIEPSGLLHVSGEQLIAVNEEKQEIKLEGKVRPGDIGENNTVNSSRLSDAKISYIGEGILGDAQRPGLFTRILNWLGLL